jgi:hypothetical protein
VSAQQLKQDGASRAMRLRRWLAMIGSTLPLLNRNPMQVFKQTLAAPQQRQRGISSYMNDSGETP